LSDFVLAGDALLTHLISILIGKTKPGDAGLSHWKYIDTVPLRQVLP
jgi:hypothetical protein